MGATFAQKVNRWQVAARILARAAEAGGFDDLLEMAASYERGTAIRERVRDLVGFSDDVSFTVEGGRRSWTPIGTVVAKGKITFNVGGYDGR
jgi:hypothetical protein